MAVSAPRDDPVSDDWFGEGSAFESSAALTAALRRLAGDAEPAPPGDSDDEAAEGGEDGEDGGYPSRAWIVRVPGAVLLPLRTPGRTGWSLDGALDLLRMTQEVMRRLREDAVNAALTSAGRALGSGR